VELGKKLTEQLAPAVQDPGAAPGARFRLELLATWRNGAAERAARTSCWLGPQK